MIPFYGRDVRARGYSIEGASWNKYPKDIKGECIDTGYVHTERRNGFQQESMAASVATRQLELMLP